MTITRLYRDEQSDATYNAQRNLSGRTHYVDEDTLRYHHSRILHTRIIANGLYFGLVESVALDMHNRSRGYRCVIFNIFGTVVTRDSLEDCKKASKNAYKDLETEAHKLEADLEATARAVLADCVKEMESVASQFVHLSAEISEKFLTKVST